MTSFLKLLHYTTRSRTLRYALRSREIYTEEPITSPEILSEPPQTQDDSSNSIQETPNSQFRLLLSVTPCMPRISSIESVNHIALPPYCLAPHPPQAQPIPLPLIPPRTSHLPLHLASGGTTGGAEGGVCPPKPPGGRHAMLT